MLHQNCRKRVIKVTRLYAFSLRKNDNVKNWVWGHPDPSSPGGLRMTTSGEGGGLQPERRASLDGPASGSGVRARPQLRSDHVTQNAEPRQTSSRSRRHTGRQDFLV